MTTPINVLVLCTGNSARSILGEMLFNHLGAGRISAYSAGSKPGGVVNPVALETLRNHGVPCDGARSKSWNEFGSNQENDAVPPKHHEGTASEVPTFDFIFTVCSNAANEVCPIWPGHPATVHWTLPDPAHVVPIEARRMAFESAYQSLKKRIEAFLALPLENLSRDQVLVAVRRIHDEA